MLREGRNERGRKAGGGRRRALRLRRRRLPRSWQARALFSKTSPRGPDLERSYRASSPQLDAFAVGLEEALARAQPQGAAEQRRALAKAVRSLVRALDEGRTCVDLGAEGIDRALLESSGVAGEAEAGLPLVLDTAGRLYLRRYYEYEERLARKLARLAGSGRAKPPPPLPEGLERMLGGHPGGAKQIEAVRRALAEGLLVLCGGPGTGKTTAVAALVACAARSLRVALAAPTGKAAARMGEALGRAAKALGFSDGVPAAAQTLHRLLGWAPEAARFRYGPGRFLPADLVIVDEASMLDVALAARLADALAEDSRLVLVGDPDQLAAVEAGAVYATLAAQAADNPLREQVVRLEAGLRFEPASLPGKLAAAIRAGQSLTVVEILRAHGALNPVGDWRALVSALAAGYDDYVSEVRAARASGRGAEAEVAGRLLAALDRHRVLCALRRGPLGAEILGDALEHRLRRALDATGEGRWWCGRPVIIEENDYAQGLWNGDIGVALADAQGSYRLWLSSPPAGLRTVAAARLPAHRTALALTVHRAQGSEFDGVALVLPPGASLLATRELVYTAVTRARATVTVYASEEALAAAVESPARREGGLAARLREAAQALQVASAPVG